MYNINEQGRLSVVGVGGYLVDPSKYNAYTAGRTAAKLGHSKVNIDLREEEKSSWIKGFNDYNKSFYIESKSDLPIVIALRVVVTISIVIYTLINIF